MIAPPILFFPCSDSGAIVARMADLDKLTPADPADLASGLAFALRYEGRKRQRDADDFMAHIVAQRLVRYLERAGYVVMQKPPGVGAGHTGAGIER